MSGIIGDAEPIEFLFEPDDWFWRRNLRIRKKANTKKAESAKNPKMTMTAIAQ